MKAMFGYEVESASSSASLLS